MIDLREDQIERYAEYLKEQKAMRFKSIISFAVAYACASPIMTSVSLTFTLVPSLPALRLMSLSSGERSQSKSSYCRKTKEGNSSKTYSRPFLTVSFINGFTDDCPNTMKYVDFFSLHLSLLVVRSEATA